MRSTSAWAYINNLRANWFPYLSSSSSSVLPSSSLPIIPRSSRSVFLYNASMWTRTQFGQMFERKRVMDLSDISVGRCRVISNDPLLFKSSFCLSFFFLFAFLITSEKFSTCASPSSSSSFLLRFFVCCCSHSIESFREISSSFVLTLFMIGSNVFLLLLFLFCVCVCVFVWSNTRTFCASLSTLSAEEFQWLRTFWNQRRRYAEHCLICMYLYA